MLLISKLWEISSDPLLSSNLIHWVREHSLGECDPEKCAKAYLVAQRVF